MGKVQPTIITYKELRSGTYLNSYIPQDEKFIEVSSMTEFLRRALCACPFNNKDSNTAMYLMLDDGLEVGRCYMYGVKFKASDSLYDAQVFFGVEALPDYRASGVGTSLLLFPLTNKEYDFVLIGGMTSMVIPMYRKIKYHIFEVPQFSKIMNARYFLIPLGFRNRILSITSCICNCMLKLMNSPNMLRSKRLKKKFLIKRETTVPAWAGDLATNDGHKYMELHNREWLQWNLDHNSHGFKEDTQSFFSVFDKQERPVGFFMINERLKKTEGRIHDSIRGKLLEWGTYDSSILSETDINILALSVYSKSVDIIMTITTDSVTLRNIKRMGFVQRGFFHIGIRDKKNVLIDVNDQSQWRLRFGYTNTIIY